MTIPAGLMAAGTTSQLQAAAPAALVDSTIRIALGFTSDAAAVTMARAVMNGMLLNQLKVAALLVLIAIGCSYGLWQAVAVGEVSRASVQAARNGVAGKQSGDSPKPQSQPPTTGARLVGTVKLEGTDQSIAGAKLQIWVGFAMGGRGAGARKLSERRRRPVHRRSACGQHSNLSQRPSGRLSCIEPPGSHRRRGRAAGSTSDPQGISRSQRDGLELSIHARLESNAVCGLRAYGWCSLGVASVCR